MKKEPTAADNYMCCLKELHKLKILVDRIYGDEHNKQPELDEALYESCEAVADHIALIRLLQAKLKEVV